MQPNDPTPGAAPDVPRIFLTDAEHLSQFDTLGVDPVRDDLIREACALGASNRDKDRKIEALQREKAKELKATKRAKKEASAARVLEMQRLLAAGDLSDEGKAKDARIAALEAEKAPLLFHLTEALIALGGIGDDFKPSAFSDVKIAKIRESLGIAPPPDDYAAFDEPKPEAPRRRMPTRAKPVEAPTPADAYAAFDDDLPF